MDTVYSDGHAQCRESLICMINKKLSRGVFIGIVLAMVGIPGIFIIYALAAEKVQDNKIVDIDKQIQAHSIKQDAILWNQREFKEDMDKIQDRHTKEMILLHDKMELDKKDLIKEMRRLHK